MSYFKSILLSLNVIRMPIDPTRTCSTITEWVRKDAENKLYLADQSTPWDIRKHRRTFVSRPPVYYDTIWNDLTLLAPYYSRILRSLRQDIMLQTPNNNVSISLLTFHTTNGNNTPGILTYSERYGFNWYYIYLNCSPGWFQGATTINWCNYCAANIKDQYEGEDVVGYSVIKDQSEIVAPAEINIWVISDDTSVVSVNAKSVSTGTTASEIEPTKKTSEFILNSLFVKIGETWSLRNGYSVNVPLDSSVGFV